MEQESEKKHDRLAEDVRIIRALLRMIAERLPRVADEEGVVWQERHSL